MLGIIGASEKEINPIIKHIDNQDIKKHVMVTFVTGNLKGVPVIALFCGVCKVNAAIATQVLIDRFQVTHVINIGVAGAIDENLHVFDTVVSSQIAYHDVEDGVLTKYHPWMKDIYFKADQSMIDGIIAANQGDSSIFIGKMVTGESFIVQEGRDKIIAKYQPLCVDMETASIAHVCYANQIPFVSIRSMSDTPKEDGEDSFRKYSEMASEKSAKVLMRYVETL